MRADNNNKRSYRNVVNDRSGKEPDSLVAIAERRISKAERSTLIASDKLRRAGDAIQCAARMVNRASQQASNVSKLFGIAVAPIALSFSNQESASVEGGACTGDADADRVIIAKRADASAMNARQAIQPSL